MNTNPVIVLRAISGAGKSTLAKELARTLVVPTGRGEEPMRYVIVSTDDEFTDDETGDYTFEPSKIGIAHGRCFRRAIEAIQRGHALIVDNTNCSVAEIAPYMLLAQAYNRPARVITVRCDVDTAFERATHGAPRDAIEAMAAALEAAVLSPWWEHEER